MKKIFTFFLVWLSAITLLHAVTFNVVVPEGTMDCYVTGEFNSWSATGALEMTSFGENTFTLTLPSVTEAQVIKGYKYLCTPSWDYVETTESGGDVGNRLTLKNPDVVAGWKKMPLHPNVRIETIKSNFPDGVKSREFQVLLPSDYETNTEKKYPILYMHGIEQFYENSGGDSGFKKDEFFTARSWDIARTAEALQKAGMEVGIIVGIHGFMNELSPWENEEFMGSGKADEYLNVFLNEIMPLVESKYRILSGPENTSLGGADMGGLFAYYTALKHQDKFGNAAFFSPSFWFNENELNSYLSSWTKSNDKQRMFFAVGGREGAEFKDNARLFYEATKSKGFKDEDIVFNLVPHGLHKDISWKKQFANTYSFLLGEEYVLENEYQFMSHSSANASGVDCSGKEPFATSLFYPTGTDKEIEDVMLYMKVIPADIKLPYKYNINKKKDCSGENLWAENLSIGFNTNRNTVCWTRAIVTNDGTFEGVNASKDHFRVYKRNDLNGTLMKQVNTSADLDDKDAFTVSAEVSFTSDKYFTINYGDVNSGEKQDQLVDTLKVGDYCVKAEVIYDFMTNKVTVNTLESEYPEQDYCFMSATKESELVCKTGHALQKITYYPNGVESREAKVFIKEVPVSMKSKYYWNLNIGTDCNGNNFFSSPKEVGFSSSKQYISWIRVAVYDDLSSENVAVSSNFFRVIKEGDSADKQMKRTKFDGTTGSDDTYTVSAEVDFLDKKRTFSIYPGTVNSGSKMDDVLTTPIAVSEYCSKAQIIYSFKTNKVTVKELEHKYVPLADIISMNAIPSVCKAGTSVAVSASVRELDGYTISYKLSQNYGTAVDQNYSINNAGEYVFTFTPTQGIYEITLSAKKEGYATITQSIWVKVPHGEEYQNIDKGVVSNAYKEVDWETTGRYKGNFHTHTSQSFDSSMKPDNAVDLYRSKGYQILALTDHDDNTYPWSMFNTFDYSLENRYPEQEDMLTFPAIELSKDNNNSWQEEALTGDFNHHNDFFTGRKGQEFATLQESYAYTNELGGMQIINHPGQYWSRDKSYNNDKFEKNSPAWHARNFQTYESLIGLEVYNQGNRRPNDRVLWDQILSITMPERPVYGYSCDDSHYIGHYYGNYQFMLMEELSIPALKDAMRKGKLYFSYEPGKTGDAKAPRISSIAVDEENKTITVDADSEEVYWIAGVDLKDDTPSTRKSTIVGYGKTFHYEGFQGKYVRAFIKNQYGETCTQPFGFAKKQQGETYLPEEPVSTDITVYPNPAKEKATISAYSEIESINMFNISGQLIRSYMADNNMSYDIDLNGVSEGIYVLKIETKEIIKSSLLHVVK